MLSLIDLIEARTVDLPFAAYLAAAMRGGASLLVGARPGGAGKTAVMVALLNFLPRETRIVPIEGLVVLRRGLQDTAYGATCYLAPAIGDSASYAYIWGEQARLFFQLAGQGHIVATNLHADTLEETRTQLCDARGENGVAIADLRAVTLKLFLRVTRGPDFRLRRVVRAVYGSTGAGAEERLVWTGDDRATYSRQAESALVSPEVERAHLAFLESLQARRLRALLDVRRAVVEDL